MPKLRPLIGGEDSDKVVVIGRPVTFDLFSEIEAASEVLIATAFSHMTGWMVLEKSIKQSSASIKILTGLDFWQTEPEVLRRWHDLGKSMDLDSRIYTGNNVFHPKVFVVTGKTKSFALVGSGNLSEGGLRNNVECFVYVKEGRSIDDLKAWFNGIFDSDAYSCPVTSTDITEYAHERKPYSKQIKGFNKSRKSFVQRIGQRHQASLAKWNKAVSEARKYFASKEFKSSFKEFVAEVDEFKGLLNYPEFDFDRNRWSRAYDIQALGHIIPLNKAKVFDQSRRLKSGLRRLVDEEIDVVDRINSLVDKAERTYVSYLGMNMTTKVLAAHQPEKWPVLNEPVRKTLKHFGYTVPRGLSEGERYKLLADLLNKFMKETGAKNMLMLDRFFYEFANKLDD